MRPLWIDFEGVDGSGKTSVSTRVAEALRRGGHEVVHAREGGVFASRIAGRVRDLVRGVDVLGLAPEAELLLNLAREAQLVAEIIRPALERGAWVVTDRTTYSHLALARWVRGLSAPEAEAAARIATRGLRPDRVVLVDVDPDIARWRRRIRKIRERRLDDAGRKGLIGDALVEGTRRGLRELAAAGGWTVVDNTWTTLEETVESVMGVLRGGSARGPNDRGFEADPERVEESYFEFAGALEDRSLAGLLAAGLDDAQADRLRRAAPADVAAYAVSGMDSPSAWELREELREEEPYYVARSLAGLLGNGRAWSLRRALEGPEPGQVLHSLAGEAGEEAHTLRMKHFEEHPEESVRSTRGLRDENAWAIRARARREGKAAPLAESLIGLNGPEAWEIRAELAESCPLSVLKGLKGVDHPEAWALRRRLAGPAAKSVLASIEGMGVAEAAALREELKGLAPEETAASLLGLEGPEAWRLREELKDAAPVGVIKSLARSGGERADDLVSAIVEAHPHRLRVARETLQYLMSPQWTPISI
jgi:dTMP kinase